MPRRKRGGDLASSAAKRRKQKEDRRNETEEEREARLQNQRTRMRTLRILKDNMPRIRKFGYKRRKPKERNTLYAKQNDMEEVIDPTPLPVECRTCLNKFDDAGELLDLFQPWETLWDGMGDTIVQDLTQIANIDISRTDEFSKLICRCCYQKLLEACYFVATVRVRDRMLRQQVETPDNDSAWPKPIQVHKIIKKDALNTPMEIEVKQEVPDEEAYTITVEEKIKEDEESECLKSYPYFDVKAEPEENPSPPIYSANGSTTQDELEDNCNAIFSNHKSIKEELQYDATSENLQEVEMLLKKEFNDDETAECGDINLCDPLIEETQSDSNPRSLILKMSSDGGKRKKRPEDEEELVGAVFADNDKDQREKSDEIKKKRSFLNKIRCKRYREKRKSQHQTKKVEDEIIIKRRRELDKQKSKRYRDRKKAANLINLQTDQHSKTIAKHGPEHQNFHTSQIPGSSTTNVTPSAAGPSIPNELTFQNHIQIIIPTFKTIFLQK